MRVEKTSNLGKNSHTLEASYRARGSHAKKSIGGLALPSVLRTGLLEGMAVSIPVQKTKDSDCHICALSYSMDVRRV